MPGGGTVNLSTFTLIVDALIGATPGRPGEHLIFSKCHQMLATAGWLLKFGGIQGFDYYIIVAFTVWL